MKNKLLPHSCKRIGWLLFIPSLLLGVFLQVFDHMEAGPRIKVFGWHGTGLLGIDGSSPIGMGYFALLPNLTALVFLIAGLLIMFSKEKKEDEYINQMRLQSLRSAVLINYLFLFLSILFIHGLAFLNIMLYNLFTIIIIYVGYFHFLIFKNTGSSYE